MVTTRKSLVLAALAVLAIVALASTALGATTYLGGASASGGQVTLVSNTSDGNADNDYSVAVFDVPEGTTFADLGTLSTDYNVTDDGCMGGSPRFQIRVDTGTETKNIFAYLGPEPNYTNCPLNTTVNSGDVLTDGRAIDTSQLPGGTFYDTYAHALSAYGDYEVVSVMLVADAGWASGDGEQTIIVDNVNIDGTVHDFTPPPTSTNQCKKGGWESFSNPSFKNQGQCVSYVNRNK